MIFSCIFFNCF